MKPYDREAAVDALADMIQGTDQVADMNSYHYTPRYRETEDGGVEPMDPATIIAEHVLVTLHPIIETQEQLDAVREGTVLIDSYRPGFNGDVYRASLTAQPGPPLVWWQAGPQGAFHSVQLPAMILHKGTGMTAAELTEWLTNGPH